MLANAYSTPPDSNPQPVSSQFEPRFYARVIRSLPLPERQACYICGKYKHISHAHHIIPVNQMAKLLAMQEFQPEVLQHLKVSVAWLCPNHHAMIHVWDKNTLPTSISSALMSELDPEEQEAISHYLTSVVASAWSKFHAFIEEYSGNE